MCSDWSEEMMRIAMFLKVEVQPNMRWIGKSMMLLYESMESCCFVKAHLALLLSVYKDYGI